MVPMASLQLCSLNVRGFNVPEKRSKVLYGMHKKRVDILLLQETHFRADRIPKLNHKYYTQWFHGSNSDPKSKGVSIALHKSLQAQVVASKADSNGRYVFLKLKIAHDLFTIAYIYLPNQDQVRACRKYLRDLSAIAEGYVIMGGDFNMVLDRAVDSSSGRSVVSLSQLERLRRALTDSRAYYDSLYNLSGPLSDMSPSEFQARVDDYIRDTELPPMSVEESEALESPLSEQEVLDTIKSLANGKSPGPDGFSAAFYKLYANSLVPFMTKLFNSISASCPFAPQTLMATITVIPKPGKDPLLCASYRPISLINVDVKVFAKVLAGRLNPILPGSIHSDQVGFVPHREAKDNTVKTLLLTSYMRTGKVLYPVSMSQGDSQDEKHVPFMCQSPCSTTLVLCAQRRNV
ncbi:unnamed protein product [Ranitomeya imitator]|uniref:Reverse transcriptase domain-containing protein n=1 Tax=Ranitomeya imitator TaxID=111125 RepID=A0ABN9MAY2_9NEOB|nr:unnamed protein product [Ranitomeya imitator]